MENNTNRTLRGFRNICWYLAFYLKFFLTTAPLFTIYIYFGFQGCLRHNLDREEKVCFVCVCVYAHMFGVIVNIIKSNKVPGHVWKWKWNSEKK